MNGTWYVTTDSEDARKAADWDDILETVRGVRDGDSEFFIVEADPESGETYIQATLWSSSVILGRRTYMAEIREPRGDGFRHLRMKTRDFREIEDAVRRYTDGEAPAGRWDDVTDEFVDDPAGS